MAVTYESISSGSIQDAALVLTKPTGLAVGDLLLAGIYFSDNNGSTADSGINTPAGWTLQEATTTTQPPEWERLSVFLKIADSADVAASAFTFTRAGTDISYHLMGHLLRISDYGIVAGETSTSAASNSATTITATTFTPTRADTLFVAFLGNSCRAGDIQNTSVALATDNPTWTERNEQNVNDTGTDSNFAVYTASRSQTTATGTITGTMGSATAKSVNFIILSLSESTSSSATPTTKTNAYAFSPLPLDFGADAYAVNPTIDTSNPTVWTPVTKS